MAQMEQTPSPEGRILPPNEENCLNQSDDSGTMTPAPTLTKSEANHCVQPLPLEPTILIDSPSIQPAIGYSASQSSLNISSAVAEESRENTPPPDKSQPRARGVPANFSPKPMTIRCLLCHCKGLTVIKNISVDKSQSFSFSPSSSSPMRQRAAGPEVALNQPTRSTLPEHFTRKSMLIRCPYCNRNGMTDTEHIKGDMFWLCFALLIIVCCFTGMYATNWSARNPCCWLPFVLCSWHDVAHRCGNCGQLIGTYDALKEAKE